MSRARVPKSFQSCLWSVKVGDLDIEEDKVYMIHQLLAYGGFKEWEWLLKTYPLSILRKIFVERPMKIYDSSIFNFVKNIVLGLKEVKLSPFKYDRSLPRIIRGQERASLKMLGSNKAFAILKRRNKEDYYYLFYLLKKKILSLAGIIKLAKKHFGIEFTEHLFLAQLTYFEDLGKFEMEFLKEKFSEEEIKELLTREVEKYTEKVLKGWA